MSRSSLRTPTETGRFLVASACLVLAVAGNGHAQSVAAQAPDTVDVLFIGNSYVYYNNLADQLEEMSEALGGPVLRTEHHLHGGFSLRRHLDDGHIPGELDRAAPDGQSWERVVIQEHSRLGVDYADEATGAIGDRGPFFTAAGELISMVRDRDAEPLLYMTWAKAAFPDQTDALAEAYETVGARYDVPVAPVGLAWDRVREERPDLELFDPDGSHPSPAGTYLVASVFYATLTGRSPEGAPTRLSGIEMETPGVVVSPEPTVLVELDAETATYLQRVAWETVRGR